MCLQMPPVFLVVCSQQIVDNMALGNEVCIADIVMLHMVIAYQLPCSFITDPTQHLTKFL